MVDSTISNLLVDAATVARGSEQDPESANSKASTDSTTTAEVSDATASSTASSTSEERSAVDVERYLPFQSTQQQIIVLTQLSKQLEYYFSQQNLANDPYLQTLRDLNDGCAPVNILANFTKVKLLLPMADDDVRIHAILQAATQYSELLRVLSIDTSTGHVATDLTPSSAKTILAVGPVGQEPLSLSSSSSAATASARTSTGAAASSSPPLPSTIILRDVLPDVTEEQVRVLFEQLQDCPTVTSIHMDVGICWYVSLSLSYLSCALSRRKISFKCHHHRTKKHVLTLALSLCTLHILTYSQVCQARHFIPRGHAISRDATTNQYLGWSPGARSTEVVCDSSCRPGWTDLAAHYALDVTSWSSISIITSIITEEKENTLARKKEKEDCFVIGGYRGEGFGKRRRDVGFINSSTSFLERRRLSYLA
jgi:hypothetical protein